MNYIYSAALHNNHCHNHVHSYNSSGHNHNHQCNRGQNRINSFRKSYVHRYNHSSNINNSNNQNNNKISSNNNRSTSSPIKEQPLIINSLECGVVKTDKVSFKSDYCKVLNKMVSDGDKIGISNSSSNSNSGSIQDEINRAIGSIYNIDQESLVIALIYLDKTIKSGTIINSSNVMQHLAVCICVAHKYHQDICHRNETFCSNFFKIGTIDMFNDLEKELLEKLNYNCTVSLDDFEKYRICFGTNEQQVPELPDDMEEELPDEQGQQSLQLLQRTLHQLKKQHQQLVQVQQNQEESQQEVKKTIGKRKRGCDDYDGNEDSAFRDNNKKHFGTNESSEIPSYNINNNSSTKNNSTSSNNNSNNNNNNNSSSNNNSNNNNSNNSKSTPVTSIHPDSIIQTAGFPIDQVVKAIDYGDDFYYI